MGIGIGIGMGNTAPDDKSRTDVEEERKKSKK